VAHWYQEDGKRLDVVPGAKGQPVTPDLRHARKLNLAPGVTTIIRCAASEALTVYRERQVLMAALTLPRPLEESDAEFIARVMHDSRQHAEDAALVGTALHAEIEHGINEQDNTNPYVIAARTALEAEYGPRTWKTEWSAVSQYGFATKSDLCSESSVLDGRKVVVDIKSKDGPLDEMKTYDEHHMQLAATAQALRWQAGVLYGILFLRRDQPEARLAVVEANQVDRGWSMFKCLLQFWQAKNNYKPDWAQDVGDNK